VASPVIFGADTPAASDSAAAAAAAAPAPLTTGKADDVLATVGDITITRAKFENELKNLDPRAGKASDKELQKKILTELVDLALLEQEAGKQPEVSTPEFATHKKNICTNYLSQAVIQGFLAQAASAAADVKVEEKPATPPVPGLYHLHQITFKTADEAKTAKKDIEGGKLFADVAKAQSTDSFKDRGGDRGFLELSEMLPGVSDALKTLKQDAISEPVLDASGSSMLVKYSETQAADEGPGAKGPDPKQEAQKAAFEKLLDELSQKMNVKINEENAKLLAKTDLSAEDKEKPLITMGSETIKLSALLADLEQIPEFIRPQILGGDGLKDFVKQFSYRMVVKQYVDTNFDELSKQHADAIGLASREALIKSFLNGRMKPITVSDDEIKDFYSKNLTQFTRPEQMRAHHILVDGEDKAKAIMDRLTKGEKLEDLAKTESKCPSKDQGGDLGMFEKGRMVPEFEAALEKAEIGKAVGPVKTQFGFHIVRLDEKKPAGTTTLDEVKEQIKSQLLPRKHREVFENLMKELRTKYPVKDFPEKL
jgi:peptidyl-prolyl cis-trans isomerase C